jgi:hypothetical protein
MRCVLCGKTIPQARIDALPGVQTCISCSTTVKYQGCAEGVSKSVTVLHVLDPNTAEGREDIARMRRYTPYRFGSSVMYTGGN